MERKEWAIEGKGVDAPPGKSVGHDGKQQHPTIHIPTYTHTATGCFDKTMRAHASTLPLFNILRPQLFSLSLSLFLPVYPNRERERIISHGPYCNCCALRYVFKENPRLNFKRLSRVLRMNRDESVEAELFSLFSFLGEVSPGGIVCSNHCTIFTVWIFFQNPSGAALYRARARLPESPEWRVPDDNKRIRGREGATAQAIIES